MKERFVGGPTKERRFLADVAINGARALRFANVRDGRLGVILWFYAKDGRVRFFLTHRRGKSAYCLASVAL